MKNSVPSDVAASTIGGRWFVGLLLCGVALGGYSCRNLGGPPPPRLVVSPPSLAFTGVAGGIGPPRQPLTVDAIGTGWLTWAASADVPWLSVSPASDTAPAVTWVAVLVPGLQPGAYAGHLTIETTSGPFMRVPVPVTLDLAPVLSLTGRWAGATDTVTVALTIAQTDTIVAGSGTLNPPLTSVSVAGTYRHPSVRLTLRAPDSTVTTFSGSLVNENAITGVLDGGRLSSYPITVFRQ